jgi:hypothetical protein
VLSGLLLPAEAFIIPLYYNLRTVGLTDTYWALVLPQTAQSLAFGIFWMRNQFRTFPTEIMEAGRLDGATDWRLLWRIVVPPSTPGHHHHVPAGDHVDLERVPDPADHGVVGRACGPRRSGWPSSRAST